MRLRTIGLLLSACLLTSCSSSSSIMHSYKHEIEASNSIINKDDRLGSFSQSQVYLKSNSEYPVEDVSAGRALVFEFNNADNPVVLCKNAYQQFQPGFLTRLYGAYMVASNADIYNSITINSDIFQVDTSLPTVGFTNGDEVRIKDLLYSAVMAGKCDVMIPLALNYSNNIASFSSDINSFLKELGCEQTNITNVYGTEQTGQYTNIYDLYVSLGSILKNEDICSILTARNYSCDYVNAGNNLNATLINSLPYFTDNNVNVSGVTIVGGICDVDKDNLSSMLVIAQAINGKEYIAYVGGCNGYENTKVQMELVLSKIS